MAASSPAPKPRTFMDPGAFHERFKFLMAYVPLAQSYPAPEVLTVEPDLAPLFGDATHGNITIVEPAIQRGRAVVALSIQGRPLRFLAPLDYVAIDLLCGFGLHLTIQKTSAEAKRRRDYPRISTPGPQGWVFQVLRILADAQPGQVVRQRREPDGTVDHHYLGRERLSVTSDDALRDQGMKLRHTTRGRTDLLRCAEEAFAANLDRFELPPSVTAADYGRLLRVALTLADWRHGRLDGQCPAMMVPAQAEAA